MNRTSWFVCVLVLGLSSSFQAAGQESKKPVQAENGQQTKTENPFADIWDKPLASKKGTTTPVRPRSVDGLTGGQIFPLPPLTTNPAQRQAATQGPEPRTDVEFNRPGPFPLPNQPPIYLPNYNPNRPYGYPSGGFRRYGYGFGYGFGYGVVLPGSSHGTTGGSHYFGNPHGSHYFGKP